MEDEAEALRRNRPKGGHAWGQTGPKGITEDQIEWALRKTGGILLPAARALNCSRANLRERINNSSRLLAVVEEMQEEVLDLAEAAIVSSLSEKNKRLEAAKFVLDRLGSRRGYSKTVKVLGKDGGPVQTSVSGRIELSADELDAARAYVQADSE